MKFDSAAYDELFHPETVETTPTPQGGGIKKPETKEPKEVKEPKEPKEPDEPDPIDPEPDEPEEPEESGGEDNGADG